jgi:sugar phosphate isomerase/epimerase
VSVDRRGFLKLAGTLGAGIGWTSLNGSRLLATDLAKGTPNAEKLGWRVGVQTWTFHRLTLFEAIENTASLGLKYLETYVGQRLSKDHPTAQFRASMPVELRRVVKEKLAHSGVTLLSHYEVAPPYRELFAFCKDMGVEMLITEPPAEALDVMEKLCEEYAIALALTNHPKPALYWNPDIVAKVCNGRGKRIGASCDLGHWVREGLNPADCLAKVRGRIFQFHFRDMSKYGRDTRDVPLGTGMCDIRGILAEVHRQGIKPIFMLEYEDSYALPQLAQSVKFFDEMVAVIVSGRP